MCVNWISAPVLVPAASSCHVAAIRVAASGSMETHTDGG